MQTLETFFRPQEIRREARTLPPQIYNLARVILSRSREGAVFVPIRSMLFQAVVDRSEIIFVDAAVSHRNVVLAWQNFKSVNRHQLETPLPYEVVYYQPGAWGIMARLQGEFLKSLRLLKQKQDVRNPAPAPLIDLAAKRSTAQNQDTPHSPSATTDDLP